MSKAFDKVDRNKLLEMLAEILDESEMRLMDILISDVLLNVRLGDTLGKDILTLIGIAQGDCLSAILFIFYLAIALKNTPTESTKEDHSHRILWSELDWIISKDVHNVEVEPQYADDITYIRSDYSKINQIKRTVPPKLKENNLLINNDKTEEYHVKRENDKWKECKLLGTIIDTEKDINSRNILALDAYKILNYVFNSRKVSEKLKLKFLQTYIP